MRAKGSLDKSALGPARSTTAELNLCRDTTIFQIDAPFSALVTSLPAASGRGLALPSGTDGAADAAQHDP